MVSALAQEVGKFIGQVEVADSDVMTTAVDVLRGIPLKGKVVTLDAVVFQKPVTEVIPEKGGPISGC